MRIVLTILALGIPASAWPGEAAGGEHVIAIIGTGNVADSLGPKLASMGQKVLYGSRTPDSEKARALVKRTGKDAAVMLQTDAAAAADIVILAVRWPPMESVAQNLGDLGGKILVDVSFPFTQGEDGYPESSVATSSAEMIQGWNPGARVVKWSLPTVYFVDHPEALTQRPANWIASDDRDAKEAIARLSAGIGQDPIDAGPLRMSSAIESQVLLMMVPLFQRRPLNWEFTVSRSNYWACLWQDEWFRPVGDHAHLAEFPDPGIKTRACSEYAAEE